MTPLRAAFRLMLLGGLVAISLPSGFACRTPEQRARWMQRIARRILRVLGGEVETRGPVPTGGLVVSNHLGYLDVFVLGSLIPAIFVAKSDVRRWPAVGLLCRLSGTIFVERDRRHSASESLRAMNEALAAGRSVIIFPEGTSSDGVTVLPFKTSLLEATTCHPTTPAAIDYDLPGGSVADELCYWRDMTFAPHFWHVLGLPGFAARAHFGKPQPPADNRKTAATDLRAKIAGMKESG